MVYFLKGLIKLFFLPLAFILVLVTLGVDCLIILGGANYSEISDKFYNWYFGE